MTEPAPSAALGARLDLIRGDFLLQHLALTGLLEIARIYAELGLDDRLTGAMNDVTARMRAAVAVLKRLQEAHADAALNAEAAQEWRAEQGRKRA